VPIAGKLGDPSHQGPRGGGITILVDEAHSDLPLGRLLELA
jgi:hypothetical protein